MLNSIGLTSEEAAKKLIEYGPNELTGLSKTNNFKDILKIFLDPMGVMLLSLAGLYYLIGNTKDATLLMIAYIPIILVDAFMEYRTQKALTALKAKIKGTTKVYRDGHIRDENTKLIVPGDVILFEEGQSLPVDGKVIEASHLMLDESSLTGESLPVDKSMNHDFYGGTTVLQGRGLGLVEATGQKTKYGKIANLLAQTEDNLSPLQKKVGQLFKVLLLSAVTIVLLLFFIEIQRGRDYLHSLVVALTFAMASIPEEFPLVYTLFLSFGAWRLSKHGVLVKSLPSVEALGSVDIICTDKTGTLTEGKFQLEELLSLNNFFSRDESWQFALMACEEKITDSLEIAISNKAKHLNVSFSDWELLWDYPFDLQDKYMSHVWLHKSMKQMQISMKGSIEGVLQHCLLTQEEKKKIEKTSAEVAAQGKRLLALAGKKGSFTGNRHQDEKDLSFIGLLIFSDPVRATAKKAIENCQKAGIQIKMLTGDHPLTAHAIAHETGIKHSHNFIFTGNQLNAMTDLERAEAYKNGALFSRVLPEQKHEMVKTLKASGFVVAMTGDGINDAPALKLADVGISMGENATDVARASAKMILMKNDFNGIAEAVLEGRRLFSSLKKSFSYLITFHIPIILLTLLPPLFGIGDLLLPIQIVLLELIVHPISAITFENLSTSHKKEIAILSKKHLFQSSLSGVLLSLSCFLMFFYFNSVSQYKDTTYARSISFAAILFGNLFFVWVEAWPEKNKRISITSAVLAILIYLLFSNNTLSTLFNLNTLKPSGFLIAFSVGAMASMPTYLIKRIKT